MGCSGAGVQRVQECACVVFARFEGFTHGVWSLWFYSHAVQALTVNLIPYNP